MSNRTIEVLRIAQFRNYVIARMCMTFAVNMLSTIIMWQVYEITNDSFNVGMIGLAEFIPFVVITFFAGYLADIIDRKRIILICTVLYSISVMILFYLSSHQDLLHSVGIWGIYGVNAIIGFIRGFLSPAQSAFAAQLVPREYYTYSSNSLNMTWHIGSVAGPAVAGLVYAKMGAPMTYTIILSLVLLSFCFLLLVPKQPLPEQRREPLFKSIGVGLDFVFNNQVVLGALTLDMLAVLFGGAVAMLPGFSREVLHVGAEGLGYLRAAPAIGAIIMGIIIAKYPPSQNAGRKLLWAVAGFGGATILFGLSQNYYLSLFALGLTGFFDNISMVIRSTIIQRYTPDEMRGRVSAVNSIFIGSSNELGAFESGVASRLMGTVPSVIFGGAMTLMVVLGISKLMPKLKDMSLED